MGLNPDYPFMRCWRCKARSELIQSRPPHLWEWHCPSCQAAYSYHPGLTPFFRCKTPDPDEIRQLLLWKPRLTGQDAVCPHARYVGGVTRYTCERQGGCQCPRPKLTNVIVKKAVRMLVFSYTKRHFYHPTPEEA
ncbi:hypothetical protein Dxin01_02879 [Deinococcus xinjiangensis]|uniref:Uncharacterized protein n=1 Tax=Deinococcus xinjiangensis TaxID=457454 RepID=A0ABP9VD28_9DEIO